MHARVVRFTGVAAERISDLAGRVQDEGPPPGVDASGIEVLFDEAQGTAVVVVYFETEEKMREASTVFDAMDASETPGARASVDACEIKVQRSLTS